MTTTKSPLSSDGLQVGFVFPIRIIAARAATRPTGVPSASTTNQSWRTWDCFTTIVFEDIPTPNEIASEHAWTQFPCVGTDRTHDSPRQGEKEDSDKALYCQAGIPIFRGRGDPGRGGLSPGPTKATCYPRRMPGLDKSPRAIASMFARIAPRY